MTKREASVQAIISFMEISEKTMQTMTQYVKATNEQMRVLLRTLNEQDAPLATEYMNEKQASAYLSIPVGTLRQKRSKGEEPAFYKQGSSVRYKHIDLNTCMDKNRIPTNNEVLANF